MRPACLWALVHTSLAERSRSWNNYATYCPTHSPKQIFVSLKLFVYLKSLFIFFLITKLMCAFYKMSNNRPLTIPPSIHSPLRSLPFRQLILEFLLILELFRVPWEFCSQGFQMESHTPWWFHHHMYTGPRSRTTSRNLTKTSVQLDGSSVSPSALVFILLELESLSHNFQRVFSKNEAKLQAFWRMWGVAVQLLLCSTWLHFGKGITKTYTQTKIRWWMNLKRSNERCDVEFKRWTWG